MRALRTTLLLLIPLLAFWGLAWQGVRTGEPGPWQRQSVRLWKESRWEELNALADNLRKLGLRDSHATCLAAIAASRLQQHDRAQAHAARYLKTRALNRECEQQVAALYPAANPIERIRLYRARIAYPLLALVALLNLASFVLRRDLLPWAAALSLIGCVILLI